jgi:hypothetical protein
VEDSEVGAVLRKLSPDAREILRRLMTSEQHNRDSYASALLRVDSVAAATMAELLDMASLQPDLRRRIARVLGELEGADG